MSPKMTDEIAKLRPVVIRDNRKDILYGIDKDIAIYLYGNGTIKHCRLAKVDELED